MKLIQAEGTEKRRVLGGVMLAVGLLVVGLLSTYGAGASVRVAPPPAAVTQCSDQITNGGFDTGNFSGWDTIGNPWAGPLLPYQGDHSALLGGRDNADDTFYQDLSLPADATSATLTFSWYIYTEEGGIGTPIPYDFLEVEIRDSGGAAYQLESLDNASTTDLWQQTTVNLDPVEFPSLFGGTSRLVFHGTTDASNPTSFSIDEVRLEVCTPAATCDDAYEPNDSFGAAWHIEPDYVYSSYICDAEDVDYYWFQVTVGQDIQVDLYALPEWHGLAVHEPAQDELPADYDLVLYDGGQNEVRRSASGGTAPEQIVYEDAAGGTYYAKVYGYNGAHDPDDAYVLLVSLSDAPTVTPTPTRTSTPTPTPTRTPECAYDAYEDNDSFSAAREIWEEVEYEAYICPEGDEDWYRFGVSQGEIIRVDLWDLPTGRDYDLYLHHPSTGQPVAESRNSNDEPEVIEHRAGATGEYRVKVVGFAGAYSGEQGYRLRVTLSAAATDTPTPTRTRTTTPTATGSPTPTPTRRPTDTPTPAPAPTDTLTPAPAPTDTPTPAPAPTDTPTPAPAPTDTPTPAPAPTDTPTPAPAPTDTPTPAPAPTDTPTPAPAPTDTPTPAPAPTDTPTPAPAPTDTPTPAPAPTDTPTPAPALTDTPTPAPGATDTPTPALAPTDTPTPAILDINHKIGAPGSFFAVTGRNFPPNDVATIHVNGVQLGTVPTGSAGGFVVLLNTEVADPGRYSVTATVNPEGYTIFLLDSDAPTWPSEGGGPLVQVPPGIALADIIYLPLIRR